MGSSISRQWPVRTYEEAKAPSTRRPLPWRLARNSLWPNIRHQQDNHALQVFVIRDSTRVAAAFQGGQAYANYILWARTPADCAQLDKDTHGRVRRLVRDATLIRSLFPIVTRPHFDDPRVSQTLYLAVDRTKAGELAYRGMGVRGTFFIPPYVGEPQEEFPTLPPAGWIHSTTTRVLQVCEGWISGAFHEPARAPQASPGP